MVNRQGVVRFLESHLAREGDNFNRSLILKVISRLGDITALPLVMNAYLRALLAIASFNIHSSVGKPAAGLGGMVRNGDDLLKRIAVTKFAE
jgi:hypothetical protein